MGRIDLEKLAESAGAVTLSGNKFLKIPPVDEYVKNFKMRYSKEKAFKEIVHRYLQLTMVQALSLKIGRIFRPDWYEQKSGKMIEDYAKKIRENAITAYEIQQTMSRYEIDLKSLKEAETKYNEKSREAGKLSDEKRIVEQARRKEERSITEKAEQKKQEEESRYAAYAQEINLQADAQALIKEKLAGKLVDSGLVSLTDTGALSYNENELVKKLEDVFLDEVLESGAVTGGKEGFLKTTKRLYRDVFSHFAELNDIDELPNVDWVQSMIFSRMHGYENPEYPYLVAAKFVEEVGKGKTTVDSAIALDKSSSMNDNKKIVIARKAVLATSALMRKLNPQNKTYLSVWSDDLEPVTSLELIRNVHAKGWTNANKALDWLVDTLKDSNLGIAYLATDGNPTCGIELCKKAASRFLEYPHLMLRIFLIDGDKEALNNIKEIGKAAGPNTKVIPLDNYQLPGGMLKEMPDILRGMYSIGDMMHA